MNWYKTALNNYPYYLAIYQEGRFKGQYPSPEIALVPQLKRQWDRGDLGAGRTTTELKDTTVEGLLSQLRGKGKDPRFDDVDFYIVRDFNRPRERVQYAKLLDMIRQKT